MTHREYREIEGFMLSVMSDSAHDKHHIYRVLNSALDIASHEAAADYDVLIAACLLHDIGRDRQFADPAVCHAQAGGDMAYAYLLGRGWGEIPALHVKNCISSHRFWGDNPPDSVEAKILFDADKLDAAGALGVARTLIYQGRVSHPLYTLDSGKIVTDGENNGVSSFFQEYNYKLKKVYETFYTDRAREIAKSRQSAAVDFYERLHDEVSGNYRDGARLLRGVLDGE